jgi:LuxR family quorum-sensing system transcriptional regulator SinR
MANQGGYFDVLDWMERQKVLKPQLFFKKVQAVFGIANILYVDAMSSRAGIKSHRLHHTFSPAAVRDARALGASLIEPLLRKALAAVAPLDWSQLAHGSPERDGLDALAANLGIRACGVSYPLKSREGRQALFAIQINTGSGDWSRFRRQHDRDLQSLAIAFHAALLRSGGDRIEHLDTPRLTRRERETLYWSAAGKSYWEIAVILGISERTVRYFMANARQKLDVVSNTQAVAEASWRGLLPGPDIR